MAGADQTISNSGATDASTLATATGVVTVPQGGGITNTSGTQTIVAPLIFQHDSTISNASSTQTQISNTITSAPGQTLTVSGAGATTISSNNSGSMQGDIIVDQTTLNVADNANIGTGNLIIQSGGASGVLSMGATTLPNPVTINVAATITSNAASGQASILTGEFTGSAPITFGGTGKKVLGGTDANYSSPNYTGTMTVSDGELAINSNIPNTDLIINQGATYSGTGTVHNVYHYGTLRPGNSIGTTNINGDYTAGTVGGNAIYAVELDSTGASNLVNVSGNTLIAGTYNINILMDAGFYPAGTVIDYNILQTGGTLTTTYSDIPASFHLHWYTQPGLSFTVGTLDDPSSPLNGKSLILKLTATDDITISQNQLPFTLPDASVTEADMIDTPERINPGDVVSSNSGILADHIEVTSIVFQSQQQLQPEFSGSYSDTFRAKNFKSSKTYAGGKNTIESLLRAISQNGPVSYEKDETRVWVSPYANRSRTNPTNSNSGNQGWSGGALMGAEKRDQKNTWSVGLLTGLMGSRSHVIGIPDTFAKSKGMIFGGYNTYKYTKNWGHELLASRTTTYIDAQRYGLDRISKSPYYALSAYKTITDIGNAQLNYIFDLIEKRATCRLSSGISYQDTQTGQYTENNAGTNNLSSSSSSNQTFELYGGIGFRNILEHDKITIRTTFVYEYGYALSSTGSAVKTSAQGLGATSTTQAVAPTTFTTPVGPRQNKHYLQLNSSYLDRNTGLKFILSYSGVLYKNVQNHTMLFKTEYRF